MAERQEQLWNTYVEQQMQSSGAKIRVLMNFIPALLFFMYRKEWKEKYDDYTFWFWIAIASFVSLALVGTATTAVDRVSLYFIPIQIAVLARLPYLARNNLSPNTTKVAIVLMYTAVLFVWLFFASHSHCWVPYQNIIFSELW